MLCTIACKTTLFYYMTMSCYQQTLETCFDIYIVSYSNDKLEEMLESMIKQRVDAQSIDS